MVGNSSERSRNSSCYFTFSSYELYCGCHLLLQKRLQQKEQTIEDLQAELEGLDGRHQQALQQAKSATSAQAETTRLTEEAASLRAALAEAKSNCRTAEAKLEARESELQKLRKDTEAAKHVSVMNSLCFPMQAALFAPKHVLRSVSTNSRLQ